MFRKTIILLTLLLLISGMVLAQEGAGEENYRVQWADTLDLIGQEFNVSVACVVNANNLLDANLINFAQMLVIPADCPPYDAIESDIVANHGPLFVAPEVQGQGGGSAVGGNYRAGWADTLDVIGQEFNVSVACLAGANGLINANQLAYAQLILIPTDCEPYDSIESDIIANIEDLTEIGLTESQLGRGGGGGQSLLEPGSATEDEAAADAGGSSTETAASNVVPNEIYVIQWGDSLTRIARNFNADAACLMRVNQIFNPDLIYAGSQLLITAQCRLA